MIYHETIPLNRTFSQFLLPSDYFPVGLSDKQMEKSEVLTTLPYIYTQFFKQSWLHLKVQEKVLKMKIGKQNMLKENGKKVDLFQENSIFTGDCICFWK